MLLTILRFKEVFCCDHCDREILKKLGFRAYVGTVLDEINRRFDDLTATRCANLQRHFNR